MSGADPWTASKIEASLPMFPEGVRLAEIIESAAGVSHRRMLITKKAETRLTRDLRSDRRTCRTECLRKAAGGRITQCLCCTLRVFSESTHVGHDHDSVGVRGGVLDDPEADSVEEVLVVLDVGVLGSDLSARSEEHAVGELHDRGLVHGGDVESLVRSCVLERVAGDTGRGFVGDELDRLDDTVDNLAARRASEHRVCSTLSRLKRGLTSCSIPEYSPSVFSRMMTESTLSYGVLKPSTERQGRTFA